MLFIVWLFIIVNSVNSFSTTYISTDISSDTIWYSTNSPYVILNTIVIKQGVTLTIQPGVVIKFIYTENNNSKRCMIIDGTVSIEATKDNKVVFTSIRDDEYGGDTNDDADSSFPEGGDWGYIKITNSKNILHDCIIRYGGNYYDFGYHNYQIWCYKCSPVIKNCVIENVYDDIESGYFGKAVYYEYSDSSPAIVNNIITDSGDGIYYVGTGNTVEGPIISNNIIKNCSQTGIYCENVSSSGRIMRNIIQNCDIGIVCKSSKVLVKYNDIFGNIACGLVNKTDSVIIDATMNWWGSDSGPIHHTNPTGKGNSVSDYVSFIPFMKSSVSGDEKLIKEKLVTKVQSEELVKEEEKVYTEPELIITEPQKEKPEKVYIIQQIVTKEPAVEQKVPEGMSKETEKLELEMAKQQEQEAKRQTLLQQKQHEEELKRVRQIEQQVSKEMKQLQDYERRKKMLEEKKTKLLADKKKITEEKEKPIETKKMTEKEKKASVDELRKKSEKEYKEFVKVSKQKEEEGKQKLLEEKKKSEEEIKREKYLSEKEKKELSYEARIALKKQKQLQEYREEKLTEKYNKEEEKQKELESEKRKEEEKEAELEQKKQKKSLTYEAKLAYKKLKEVEQQKQKESAEKQKKEQEELEKEKESQLKQELQKKQQEKQRIEAEKLSRLEQGKRERIIELEEKKQKGLLTYEGMIAYKRIKEKELGPEIITGQEEDQEELELRKRKLEEQKKEEQKKSEQKKELQEEQQEKQSKLLTYEAKLAYKKMKEEEEQKQKELADKKKKETKYSAEDEHKKQEYQTLALATPKISEEKKVESKTVPVTSSKISVDQKQTKKVILEPISPKKSRFTVNLLTGAYQTIFQPLKNDTKFNLSAGKKYGLGFGKTRGWFSFNLTYFDKVIVDIEPPSSLPLLESHDIYYTLCFYGMTADIRLNIRLFEPIKLYGSYTIFNRFSMIDLKDNVVYYLDNNTNPNELGLELYLFKWLTLQLSYTEFPFDFKVSKQDSVETFTNSTQFYSGCINIYF